MRRDTILFNKLRYQYFLVYPKLISHSCWPEKPSLESRRRHPFVMNAFFSNDIFIISLSQ